VPLYNRFHRGEWITRVSGGEGALDTPGPLNGTSEASAIWVQNITVLYQLSRKRPDFIFKYLCSSADKSLKTKKYLFLLFYTVPSNSGFRIRIRIQSGQWIRILSVLGIRILSVLGIRILSVLGIRIRIQEGKNDPQK
jgi:hypothetical protein